MTVCEDFYIFESWIWSSVGYNSIAVRRSGKFLPEFDWSFGLGSGTWPDSYPCAGCNAIKLFGATLSKSYGNSISHICKLTKIYKCSKLVFDDKCMS
jgi:hypothetical protein